MSFQPVVPFSGQLGWKFLERTRAAQQAAFDRGPALQREVAHFAERIADVKNAADLVGDRELLQVALGAFGLQDDIANRFFIRKVLEEGTADTGALANRLSDTRYHSLAEAFGFDRADGPNTTQTGFAERIVAAYKDRSFEIAVGEQNENLRLALNLDRELGALAAEDISDNAKWFAIMGSPPLRSVFDTAFGLPASFAALDIDRQLEVYRARAEALFGDTGVGQFAQQDRREMVVKTFLVRTELADSALAFSPARTALTLLGG